MDRKFELQQRLRTAESAQINLLEGDHTIGKNWRFLVKVVGRIFPRSLEAARTVSQSFLLDGYILGLREALGVKPSEGELGKDLTKMSELKDKLIQVHNPRSNPWANPESYAEASWKYIPGVGKGPVWY